MYRKQIEWFDPIGIQINGIELKSGSWASALDSGHGYLGHDGTQSTALQAAIEGVSCNANARSSNGTPEVQRQLTGTALYSGASNDVSLLTTRGVLARTLVAPISGSEALGDIKQYIEDPPGSGVTYWLNYVTIRDAISGDPIDDGSGNDVWGILCWYNNSGTATPYLIFASGDPEGTPNLFVDLTALGWWASTTDGEIEIIIRETVEFRDRPFGYNLREVMNFYDVSFQSVYLPKSVNTNTDPSASNPLGADIVLRPYTATITSGAFTTSPNTITLGVGEGINFRAGSRISLEDVADPSGINMSAYIENIDGDVLTITEDPTAPAWGASISVRSGIYEFEIGNSLFTNTVFNLETSGAGSRSTIQGFVNGKEYPVTRNNVGDPVSADPGTPSNPATGANNGMGPNASPVASTGFFVPQVWSGLGAGSDTGFRIWWINYDWANPTADHDLLSNDGTGEYDRISFMIHHN